MFHWPCFHISCGYKLLEFFFIEYIELFLNCIPHVRFPQLSTGEIFINYLDSWQQRFLLQPLSSSQVCMILRMIVLLMYFITVARLLSSLYLCTLSQLVFYFPNFYLFLPDREGKGHDAGTETDINLDHQPFYHFLGTDQSKDILCWKDSEHPKWTVGSEITEDGKVGRILCAVFQIKHGILILWLYNIFFWLTIIHSCMFLHILCTLYSCMLL